MASDTDDSDVEDYSGMEQPPLIKQLTTILSEYPDDGQIIKELVQNAEDAGATQMKILYDGRQLQPPPKQKKLDKFFKGPALCFWNNAEFSNDDWRGIKMIYSSVKEKDPMKVGRFGLGFKSVFHITDFPVILSGDRVLLINPCERNPGMVCVSIKLQQIHRSKKLTKDYLLSTLEDTFGFTADTLTSGRYPGTIFWFPLRETKSKLSDTIYKEGQILDLLNSFKSDTDSLLLFLKSLHEVQVFVRKTGGSGSLQGLDAYNYGTEEPFFSVQLDNNVDEVVQERKRFTAAIQNIHGVAEQSIVSSTVATYTTQLRKKDGMGVETHSRTWLVVNYLKGGEMSDRLRTMVLDKSLSYLPCVGVAAPVSQSSNFKGHIFCFMPLPQEQHSLTGLPVHINGFFALSQNRRHLKWPTADQVQLGMHTDRSIDWNLELIEHVLPSAYLTLLLKAAEVGSSPEMVYRCIPSPEKVEGHWKQLLNQLLLKAAKKTLLYTDNNGGSWIHSEDALFMDVQDYKTFGSNKIDSIKKFLRLSNQNLVEAPEHILQAWQLVVNPSIFSPYVLSGLLKSTPAYQTMSSVEKYHLLEVLLRDSNLENVDGLQLLPLHDGTFTAFSDMAITYVVSAEEVRLFPGLEANFVKVDTPVGTRCHLKNMKNEGWYGLKNLQLSSFVQLLATSIAMEFGPTAPVQIRAIQENTREPSHSEKWSDWVKAVWAYICRCYPPDVSKFRDIPIFPVVFKYDGTTMREFNLHKLTDLMIMKTSMKLWGGIPTQIPEEVGSVLSMMSVVIVPSVPTWLRTELIQQFVPDPSPENVCLLLGKLPMNAADDFNRNVSEIGRKQLVKYLCKCTIPAEAKRIMRRLHIFAQKSKYNGNTQWTSLDNNNEVLCQEYFPVCYPRKYIDPTTEEQQLATSLGASTVNPRSLAKVVLKTIQQQNKHSYTANEVDTFMKWLLAQRFHENDQSIHALAQTTYFVKSSDEILYRPCDLYDPTDSLLKNLFEGEHRFPAYDDDSMIHTLRKLGLKSKSYLAAEDVQQTAQLLDRKVCAGCTDTDMKQKAASLWMLLEENPHLLSTCKISNLCCISQQKERHPYFPESTQWYNAPYSLCKPSELKSYSEYSLLVGSILPVVDCKLLPNTARHFRWNDPPTVLEIVSNLLNIVTSYQYSRKAQFVDVTVAAIYKQLSLRDISEVRKQLQTAFQDVGNRYVWFGDGFTAPDAIYTTPSISDIDLKPYLFPLPKSVSEFNSLFVSLGCHQHQDAGVLKTTLEKINQYHEHGKPIPSIAKDLIIVVNVLNRLRDITEVQDIETSDVLFPVHAGTATRLLMKRSGLCTFCDAQWLKDVETTEEDDDGIVYVHGDVPNSTAEKLGVKSLTQQIMSDTEGLQEWGQTEPLTRRLRNLLKEGYVDGFSIPKELFQNADDAGAEKIWFLYDERENTDARTCLIDEGMADSQGPALWVYNDAEFSDEDLCDITKFSGCTKEGDAAKIGKFGLGFSSVYNLTDVPSFVSRDNVVIFDPHTTHLGKALHGKSPGLKINLQKMKNLNMMKKLNNQFRPFEGIFGCNLTSGKPYFRGTLFRFPLRTYTQAKTSDICSIEYSRQECQKLLKLFVESAGNLLLFNQNVKDMRLYHIPAFGVEPSDPELIFTASKTEMGNASPGNNSILSTVANYRECRSLKDTPCQELRRLHITMDLKQQELLNIPQFNSQVEWLLSWASGIEEKSVAMAYENDGALPLGCVAMPVNVLQGCLLPLELTNIATGFYRNGHLFCFMPLPISTTGLPFHVNGSFAVSSDRRQLRHETEDDKSVYMKEWNESLLKDAVCRSFTYMLSNMKDLMSDTYCFHQLWPQGCTGLLKKFEDSFYRNAILLSSEIFERDGVWSEFSRCMFLDQSLREESEIWDAAFEVFSHFQDVETVIDIPVSIYNNLKAADSEEVSSRTMTKVRFFVEILLPNLNSTFFHTECQKQKRDKLICYALKMNTDVINNSLRVSECIPTQPFGKLRKPTFLVHTHGRVTSLFCIDDGRFVESSLWEDVQERLVELGMIKNTISKELIADRASSIQCLALACRNCAMERCSSLMKYLQKKHIKHEVADALECLRDIPFLPVMEKTLDWPLDWHADTIDCVVNGSNSYPCRNERCSQEKDKHLPLRLASPATMFDSDCVNFVSTFKLVLDRKIINIPIERCGDKYVGLLTYLGVSGKDSVPVQSVVKQLVYISNYFSKDKMTNKKIPAVVKSVCACLYTDLNAKCSRNAQDSDIVSKLKDDTIISLIDKFVCPNMVAITLDTQCSPYLYSIRGHVISTCTNLCESLQIQAQFSTIRIVLVLEQMKKKYKETCLSEQEIELACNLIAELVRAMERENQLFELCDSLHGVYAPNANGVLTLTTTMCFNDCADIENDSMVYIHDKVTSHDAKLLGVKTKRDQNLQDTSEEIGFFQKEPLVTRLKGLLSGYQCDIGIFKELLQNADDAKATELHFIKDYRKPESVSGFDDSLQGPSLCVYNNSSFTKEDLKGIQNLGTGSKREDPSKTGQFGVGFNAVYNITDVPSFLTKGQDIEHGETLCMFDPFAKSVPHTSRERPGRRFVDLNNFRKNHTGILNGYHENLFENGCGTMFRFPLRNKESEISKHCWTKDIMNKMFKDYQQELQETLLFLKNLRKITVSNITSSQLVKEYSVQVSLSQHGEAERKQYFEYHKHFIEKFKSCRISALTLGCREVSYEMDVIDNNDANQKWLVVQRVGFPAGQQPPEIVKQNYENGKLGLVPQGGVAVCLDEKKTTQSRRTTIENKHKAFCFLPLPIKTGLPVHVNGHFALNDEARRSLWRSDNSNNCHRTQWNESLLELVVAPCYVTALKYLKGHLLNMFVDELHRDRTILDKLKEFEMYFPCVKSVTEEYWKQLTRNVFQRIVDGCEELLPCLHLHERSGCFHDGTQYKIIDGKITWTSLHVQGYTFPAYFCKQGISISLLNTLQRLGLRISHSEYMHEALNEAGREAHHLSSAMVIGFLKSYSSAAEDRCKLVVDILIERTPLNSVEMAAEIFEYCSQEGKFSDCLERLPLLVTHSGVVKQFSVHNPVYTTKYCNIFPDDGHKFLHSLLVTIVESSIEKPIDIGVFSHFHISEFVNCLNNHRLSLLLTNVSAPIAFNLEGNYACPNKIWIQQIWEYLYEESVREVNVDDKLDTKECSVDLRRQFEKNIALLDKWALVPITTCNQRKSFSLIGVDRLHMLLNCYSFAPNTTPIWTALKSLEIPSLATTWIRPMPMCFQLLKELTATARDPVRVLKCLVANKKKLQRLSSDHCIAILRYFQYNIRLMGESADQCWIKQNLQCLPFFLTKDNICVELTDGNVVIIPSIIPNCGIADWAEKTGVIVLQQCLDIEELYEYLGCPSFEVIDVYLCYILKNPQNMNNLALLEHVKYMMTELLPRYGRMLSERQNALVTKLRHLSFVTNSSGRQLKASQLKNPEHTVFQLFCRADEFPEKRFLEKTWIKFLLTLGLQNTITGEMYLQFSEQLKLEGKRNITEGVKNKSEVLVASLLGETPEKLDGRTLQILASVNFVVPCLVKECYSCIHPQMAESMQMISFAGSVSKSVELLCWTSSNILPDWAVPEDGFVHSKWFDQHLGYLRHPTKSMVIRHCQNIGESLNKNLPTFIEKEKSPVWISKLMQTIYTYLNGEYDDEMKKQLYHVPLVYYPDEMMICPAFRVVKHCSDSQEVKPYLQRAPAYYGQYFGIFINLGASEQPQCRHYAQVLEDIKRECGTEELHPTELVYVARAVANLLKHLQVSETGDIDLGVDTLYLPNRQNCLNAASLIIGSNVNKFEKRIHSGSNLNYFISLTELDNILKQYDSCSGYQVHYLSLNLFQKLHKKYRPLLLSQIVKEELNLKNMTIHVTPLSDNIESYLHSPEFIEGLLRLVNHSLTESGLCEEEEARIISCIRNTSVQQVTGMKTDILLQHPLSEWKFVNNSEKSKLFHVSKMTVHGIDQHTLYIATTEAGELPRRVEKGILDYLHTLCNRTLKDVEYILLRIWEQMRTPDKIIEILDEFEISEHVACMPVHSCNLSPLLGSYVPVKYHTFLDNAFGIFAKHERCVAYEIEDPGLETQDNTSAPTYIYAAIVCKVEGEDGISSMFQLYKINIGEAEYITVPAYKLYRFLRKPSTAREVVPSDVVLRKPSTAREVVPSDVVPGPSQSADKGPSQSADKGPSQSADKGPSQSADKGPSQSADKGPSQSADKGPSQSADNAPLQHTYGEIRSQLSQAWTGTELERKHIIKRLLLKWHPDKNHGNEEYCKKIFQYIQQCIHKLEQGISLEDCEDETDGVNRRAQHPPNFTSSRYSTFFSNMNQRSRQHQQFYEDEARRGSSSNKYSSGYYFYTTTEHEPYHYPEEAGRWQRQAKSDCQDARLALQPPASPAYNWVCYRCHQAAEKSLKAAWFSKDATKMTGCKKNSHRLCEIAEGLESELYTLAGRLSDLTKTDMHMRYPDRHSGPNIPATAYDRQCAEEVCDIAENILTLVSNIYEC